MILFPAIDLKNGECVRLVRGDMEQATVFNPDPAAQAQKFAALKAEIDRGMADVTEGRLTEFDARSIIALGRRLSADRAKSASRKKQS